MQRNWGRMDTCICVAESLHCLPETMTALLIGYTPKQNKKFKKIEGERKREKVGVGDVPSGSMAKTPCSQCRAFGFNS